MNASVWLARVSTVALCVSCAAQVSNSSFPAHYLPQKPAYDAVSACASYAEANVLDARADPTSAGFRYSENQPTQRYRISMSGNLRPVVASATKNAFEWALLRQNQQSNAAISVTVAMFGIEERAKYNSVYDAALVLDVKVLDRRDHSVLWQSRKTGHGHNYGSPGSGVNYQETLSRSLEDVLTQLLRDSEFSRALCALGPPGVAR